MWRDIGVAALGLGAVLWAGAAVAENQATEAEPSGAHWRVAFQEARATACSMNGALADGSAFALTVFGDRDVVLLRVSNPGWRSVGSGSVHRVSARFDGDVKAGFTTTEAYGAAQTVIFMVDTPFLRRLATEKAVDFDIGGETPTARVELTDAAEAMQALEVCVASRFGASRAAQRFEALGWSSPAG